jgi:hypothetical protein
MAKKVAPVDRHGGVLPQPGTSQTITTDLLVIFSTTVID